MSDQLVDMKIGQVLSNEDQRMMAMFREQLLIVFVKRLGGKITIPVWETDNTGQDIMVMEVDPQAKTFTFEVRKKT